MSCPHGSGPPDRCSICLGAAARKVDQLGGDITIDGEVVRPISHESPAQTAYRKRGMKR